MHSQNSENLIEQALMILNQNSRLVRLSATSENFADYWFSIHNTPEDIALKDQLDYVSGREFKKWWSDLYDATRSITEIRNTFESVVIGTDKLLEYGTTERPFDRALGTHGMDIMEWNEFDEKMSRLLRYLYVWVFRKNKTGDRTDYTRFLRNNPYNVSSKIDKPDNSEINITDLIRKYIPNELFREYDIKEPVNSTTDPYKFLKQETTNFFIKNIPFNDVGSIARSQFLKDMNSKNYNFNKYWSSLPQMYANDSDIMNLLNTEITLADSTKETLYHLGANITNAEADSKMLKDTLQSLLNFIRVKEVKILQDRWIKILTGVSKTAIPFLNIYNTSLNLQGAMGGNYGIR